MLKKPLILVDGSSYLYRAFHAMPSLTNFSGFPTGAIYGVINMLRKLIHDYQPDQMAVVFDAKGKTFRHAMYTPYKANRPEMPKELVQQIEPLHEMIQALGIPLLMIEGVEADDVIGTLAKNAAKQGISVLISTGDKDLAQLIDDHITLINTMTNTILDADALEKKMGVPPHLVVDYLTLMGDTSDNVPGVPQVGPKTAVKWLVEYGSLDNVMTHASEIKTKAGENLRASLSHLVLSKQLVTIKLDVDVNITLSDLQRKKEDEATLIALYKKLEFKNWLNELLEKTPANPTENKYETLLTESQWDVWFAKLAEAKMFAVDTETTSLNYMDAEIVGLSFAIEPNNAIYIPLAHDYPDAPKQLNRDTILKKLKPLLENPDIKKIGQNMKYDGEIFSNYGITLQGMAFDTMLESYVLDSSHAHDMDSLALKHLGHRTIRFVDVAGKGAKQVTFNHVAIEKAAPYAAEDADITLKLHHVLWPHLASCPSLKFIFEKVEMPLIPVLMRIERKGVLIDAALLQKQNAELELRVIELEKEIVAMAGKSFNLNSPKQLQDILFNQLQLPILQKTPTGQPSTAENVLQELALDFPLPKLIIEYRTVSKLISTYTKRLPEQMNVKTGRVHTSYNQTGAATGRLSSSEPNLQNIPVRMKEGRRIRQAFIAPPGHKIMSADYSQIELRIMAHLSEDPNLVKAFLNDYDIHQATAAETLGIALEEVTSEQRRNAKAVNFGLIYGMSAFGLAKQLDITRDAAQDYIDRYFSRYAGVKTYMENTRKKAREKGFVETLWGRRLYLPEIHSSQIPRQKAAERTAINAPLQGTAADMIKHAMVSLDTWLIKNHLKSSIIMQVHDELVLEVPENEIDVVMKGVREHMTHAIELKVPLLVDIGTGNNWDAASS